MLLRRIGAEGPRCLIFVFPKYFLDRFNGSPQASLAVFDPVERVVGALRRQLDFGSTPLAAYKERAKEIRKGVVPETFFTSHLRCGFWSPVDETVLGVNARHNNRGKRGKSLASMGHATLSLSGWYIPCRAPLQVHWCCLLMGVSPAWLNRVNGRSEKVTGLNLRHTRREDRAWLTAPSLEWRMNEAMEELWDVGGVKSLPQIWLIS